MQLVRDQAPLLLQALLDELRQLAPLLEPRARFARVALGLHLALHRLRHAVEGGTDGVGLGTAQRRQPVGQLAALEPLQPADDHRKRRQRPVDQPEGEAADHHQHERRHGEQAREVVPGIEDGARGFRLDRELGAAGQDEHLARRRRREQPPEPLRRLAAGLVDRGRGLVQQLAGRAPQRDLVGAHVPEAGQEAVHGAQTAGGGVVDRQVADDVGGDAVGGLDLLAYRGTRIAQLVRQQHGDEYGHQPGQHEVEARAQSHGAVMSGALKKFIRQLSQKSAFAARPRGQGYTGSGECRPIVQTRNKDYALGKTTSH